MQEIQVGEVASRDTRTGIGRSVGGHGRGSGDTASTKFPPLGSLLAAGLCVANRPRIEQQAGPLEHIAGQWAASLAIEYVGVFVTKLSTCQVSGLRPRRNQHERSPAPHTRQAVKHTVLGREPTRQHVDPGESRGVGQFHPQLALGDPHLRDLHGGQSGNLKHPRGANRQPLLGITGGDTDTNSGIDSLQPKVVISGGEILEQQQAPLDPEILEAVECETVTAQLKQRSL